MPRPPPAMPAPAAGTPGCAGNGALSTRLPGAPCVCGIDPVASGLREANGLSLNRVVSLLQAAAPTAISASATARGHSRERNNSTTRDIATHSYATDATSEHGAGKQDFKRLRLRNLTDASLQHLQLLGTADSLAVMAGLVTASPIYRTCGSVQCRTRASPSSDAIHAFDVARF